MSIKLPQLNLEKFAHGYKSFYEAALHVMEESEQKDVLLYFLPKNIYSQYYYSSKSRNGDSVMSFLRETYLTGDKEIFLSFFNEIIPTIIKYLEMKYREVDSIDRNLRPVVNKFGDLIAMSNNPSVFKIDFYYDKKDHDYKRKLDEVTIESVNFNCVNLDGDNKIRYQECVSNFLLYKRDAIKNDKLFYNRSLNEFKKVVENTLQNNFRRTDGTFPMIHKKKELSNILFDNSNPDFENLIEFIIKNIHHEEGGQPKNFTEKEYVYLWLELNKILYLLNRYKK